MQDQGLEEGAQADEDDDENRQHHHRLIEIGIVRQAEQRAEQILHSQAQHDAGGEEEDQDAEQVADQPGGNDDEGGERPHWILARYAGEIADRAAELAQPFHVRPSDR